MKKDLTTTIIAAIFGVVVAYFITNIILPDLSNVSFKTLSGDNKYTLAEPDSDIFNYRAVNPTVEVYVGQCREYNENGECIDDGTNLSTEEENQENQENQENEAETPTGEGAE